MVNLKLVPPKKYNSVEEIEHKDIKSQVENFIKFIYKARVIKEADTRPIVPLFYRLDLKFFEKQAQYIYGEVIKKYFTERGKQDIAKLIDLKLEVRRIEVGPWNYIKHPVTKERAHLSEADSETITRVRSIYIDPSVYEGIEYFYNYRNLYREPSRKKVQTKIKDQLDLFKGS